MNLVPRDHVERNDTPPVATPLFSVAHRRLAGSVQNEDVRQQRRFEAICARELLGELD